MHGFEENLKEYILITPVQCVKALLFKGSSNFPPTISPHKPC